MDISKKKPFFPVNNQLETYLKEFGRIISLPMSAILLTNRSISSFLKSCIIPSLMDLPSISN